MDADSHSVGSSSTGLPVLLSLRLVRERSYSGESPVEGKMDGYSASLDLRSSKTLRVRIMSAKRDKTAWIVLDLPDSADMRVALKDLNI